MATIDTALLITGFTHAGIVAFAALVHGTIGIGFPMVATPLLALISDVRTAILLLVLPTVVINVANIFKGGRWGRSIAIYWPLAVYGMVGSFIGTRLLLAVPAESFRPVLAAMLVLYLNAERIGVGFAWVNRFPRVAFAVFGLAAGILAGTVNVMLPALIVYALEVRMPKTVMIQVFNFCFLFGKLTQGAVLAQAGLISADLLTASVLLAGLGLMALLLGMRVRERIPTGTYRRWLRRLLVVLAVLLTVQFVYDALKTADPNPGFNQMVPETGGFLFFGDVEALTNQTARMASFAPLFVAGASKMDGVDQFSIFRSPEYSRAAAMKLRNRGWGVMGRDLNSGWNWHPRYQG